MRMICLALCGAFTLAAGEVWLRDGARLPGEIKLADGAVEVGGRRVPVAAVRAIHWGEPPHETPKIVAGALPAGWKALDLGMHKQPLAVAYDRGQFTMEAFEVENPRNRMVRIQQEFVQLHGKYEALIEQCYPGSNVRLEFRVEDLLEYFMVH